jgi:hypothetical protein
MQKKTIIGIDPSLTSTGISNGIDSAVIETQPGNDLSPPRDILRRVNEQMATISSFWSATLNGAEEFVTFYIEDVLKSMSMRVPVDANGRAHAQVGVGHLFEMGIWFARFYETFDNISDIRLVSPSQLKSYVASKGNYPKAKMPLAVYKRWNVEFEQDPGLDKLHAFCLVRLGTAVELGEFEYVEPHRRGQGVRSAKKRNPS